MIENSRLQCPADIKNNSQRDKQTFLHVYNNLIENENRWRTSNQDAFREPEVDDNRNIGRRKNLIKKTLNEQVLRTIAKEMSEKAVTNDSIEPSEYFDNFCNTEFTPLMDQAEALANNFLKYPLYMCNNQTLYKEQVERGALKVRTEISNLNEPFRRNCAFTTSPDQALRQPTGGY